MKKKKLSATLFFCSTLKLSWGSKYQCVNILMSKKRKNLFQHTSQGHNHQGSVIAVMENQQETKVFELPETKKILLYTHTHMFPIFTGIHLLQQNGGARLLDDNKTNTSGWYSTHRDFLVWFISENLWKVNLRSFLCIVSRIRQWCRSKSPPTQSSVLVII